MTQVKSGASIFCLEYGIRQQICVSAKRKISLLISRPPVGAHSRSI